MAQFTPTKSLALLACLLFTMNSLWAQISIYEIPLSKQIKQSSEIIEGKVISKSTFWDDTHSNIYTAYTIEVGKVFKGNKSSFIDIIVKGGVLDLEAQVVSHSLQLSENEIGVFMLQNDTKVFSSKRSNLPTYNVISDSQGFYKYSLEKDLVVNTFSSRKGITNNFYSEIENNTGKPFTVVNANILQSLENKSIIYSSRNTNLAILSNLSATDNSAGTKSVLTINGSGFGSERGSVEFSNANYGGYIYFEALDNQILSWSDTMIEVEIPYKAGTGTVKINTFSNGTIESEETLPIDFAQINLESNLGSGNEAFQTQHVDTDANGGYTWIMSSEFKNNQDASDAFNRAFENWTCSTGVNWTVDSISTTTKSSAAQDGENVITFDAGLGSGTIGRSTSYYQGCLEGSILKWYVVEIDIVFNPNKSWNYNTALPQYNEIDFETVTLHELGHAHQLGHVVDNTEVMHYSVLSGDSNRTLSNKDLSGAMDIQQRSTEMPVCAQQTMTNSTCYLQALSNNDYELLNEIQVYPNPNNGHFYINNTTQINIDKIELYTILGELVYTTSNINLVDNKMSINATASGLYILKIKTDNGNLSKKIIVH